MAAGKTLIHYDGALGDVLLSVPCIRLIRRASLTVHLVGAPEVSSLLRETGCVNDVSSSEGTLFLSLYHQNDDGRTGRFLSEFDRAFVFTVRKDSPVAVNMARVVPGTTIIITIPTNGERMHVSDYRLKQLGVNKKDGAPSHTLTIPHSDRCTAREFMIRKGFADSERPLVAVHTGSGGKRKRWSLTHFLGLIEQLQEDHGARVMVFSGPAEDSVTKDKIDAFVRYRKDILHVKDEALMLVAALMDLCNLYIGNDSGLTHLAAALSRKVVALFGASDPLLWRPLGDRVLIITSSAPGGHLCDLSVEDVYSRVAELL